MGLILASTSPYRKLLLDRLGLPFEQKSPRYDERRLKQNTYPGAASLARALASGKVDSLVAGHPGDTLISGDQIVELEGRIFDKPETVERAIDQLSELSGRTHRIATAVAVWAEGRLSTHVDMTTLTMRTLELSAIERYVHADQPLNCAGSYKLESRGIALFERIDTADYTAIIGMPMMALTGILRSIGYVIP